MGSRVYAYLHGLLRHGRRIYAYLPGLLRHGTQNLCIFTWFAKAWGQNLCIFTWFAKAWELPGLAARSRQEPPGKFCVFEPPPKKKVAGFLSNALLNFAQNAQLRPGGLGGAVSGAKAHSAARGRLEAASMHIYMVS